MVLSTSAPASRIAQNAVMLSNTGLRTRLTLAFAGLALLIVMTMTVASQIAFRADFRDYFRDRQLQPAAALAGQLGERHDRGLPLPSDASQWRTFLDQLPGPSGRMASRMPDAIGLFRADREPIVWSADEPPEHLFPIKTRAEIIGWIGFTPVERFGDRLAQRFQQRQLVTTLGIAAALLLAAGLLGILIARNLLRPVSRLRAGTRALATGNFRYRLPALRGDELGALARDFNRLADALERNQQIRQAMTADVSHELRTPIATLRAELEAMEDGIRPVDQAAITRLQAQAGQLQRLVEDLYQLSLADAGALDYHLESVDLRDLLQAITERWDQRFSDAGLTLDLRPGMQAVLVQGDRTRLAQAIDNLMENALRYTDSPGRVEVTIDAQGDDALLQVDDTPPGVTEADRARLFSRLYRPEGSRSRESGGAGLGLSLVERIITAHNGTIDATESSLGGLRLRITLPLEATAE